MLRKCEIYVWLLPPQKVQVFVVSRDLTLVWQMHAPLYSCPKNRNEPFSGSNTALQYLTNKINDCKSMSLHTSEKRLLDK